MSDKTTPRRPFGLADVLWLLFILAAAATLRVGYLLKATDGGHTAGPLLVQDASAPLALAADTTLRGKANPNELDALVHNLSEHRWFGSLAPFSQQEEKTAHVSPGYPWLLGWLARMVPADDFESLVRWIQCGLGVLTVGLYFLFARRVFESRLVAILAGLLTALHPFWIINTAALNDGTLTAFMLAFVLFLGCVAGKTGAPLTSLLFGLSAAGLALVRASMLPFAFVAVLWLLWRSRRVEGGWMCALLVFLGFFIGLGPWAVRNWLAFEEPVPIVTSGYYHLWMGNNPDATGGPLTETQVLDALVKARGINLVLLQGENQDHPQPRRYRRLAPHVLNEIRTHPGETIYRRFAALSFFLVSESLPRNGEVILAKGDETPPSWVSPVLMASLGLMLILTLLAWRWTYPWREHAAIATIALVCVPLPHILGHAAHLHGPRLPLDGIFLTFSAFVLAMLWPPTAKLLFNGPDALMSDASQKR